MSTMEFGWDEEKNRRNVANRGLPFPLAHFLFESSTLEFVDDRKDYGEHRVQAHGTIHGRVFVCVYNDREIASTRVRWIISFRKANPREVRKSHAWLRSQEGRKGSRED